MSALGEKKVAQVKLNQQLLNYRRRLLPQKWGTVYINTTGERIQTHFTSREVGERKKYQN